LVGVDEVAMRREMSVLRSVLRVDPQPIVTSLPRV